MNYLSVANALVAFRAAEAFSAPPGTTATTATIITGPPALTIVAVVLHDRLQVGHGQVTHLLG